MHHEPTVPRDVDIGTATYPLPSDAEDNSDGPALRVRSSASRRQDEGCDAGEPDSAEGGCDEEGDKEPMALDESDGEGDDGELTDDDVQGVSGQGVPARALTFQPGVSSSLHVHVDDDAFHGGETDTFLTLRKLTSQVLLQDHLRGMAASNCYSN